MRIHACAAAVASVATFAFTPLASADSPWWRPNIDTTWLRPSAESIDSFARMQANSSEAPAFHAGDGSIYDSSLGFRSARRVANAPQSASPRTFANGAPPTLLIHGLHDPVIPAAQSDRLAERLHQLRVPHLYVKLPWATHGCDSNFHGPCGQVTTYAIERFLSFVAP